MRNIIKQTYQILRRADEAVLDFIYPLEPTEMLGRLLPRTPAL